MLSELGRRPALGGNEVSFGDEFENEIGMLLREQRRQDADDRESELNIYRSGSAPPTVEGSLNAVGGLFAGGDGGSAGAAFSEFPGAKNGMGFASEEELRSDPSYIQYYYSNVNLNPRLPPPLLSKEDWRSAQRMKGGGSSVLGGIGDRRKVNRVDEASGRSLFSMPPGFNSRKQERDAESDKVRGSAEWGVDGLIGLPGLGLGNKQKSLAEIFQDDLGRAAPVSGHPSRPASRNAFDENAESVASAESDLAHLRRDLMTSDTLRSSANGLGSSAAQSMGPSSSYSYAAALGASLSRSTTPDPQVVARAPSPCLTPIGGGRVGASEKRGFSSPSSFNAISSGMNESGDLVGAFSSMNLSANGVKDNESNLPSQIKQDVDDHQNYLFGLQGGENHARQLAYLKKSESGHMHMPSAPHSAKGSYADLGKSNGGGPDSSDRHVELQKSAVSSGNLYSKGSPTSNLSGGGGLHHQYQRVDHANSSFANYGLSGYSMNPALASMVASQLGTGNLPPLFESAMGSPGMDSRVLGGRMASGPNLAAAANESHNLAGLGSPIAGSGLQAPFVDPMYLQYLRTSEYAAAQLAALNDPSVDRNYLGNSYMNLIELQKAYLGALLSPQKSQYGVPMGGKSGGSNHHGYYGNPAFGVGMSYPGSPPVIPNSPVGPGSPMRHNELNMCYPSGIRNLAPWHLDGGCNIDESFASSLLEEFKSNKAKSFELSEIVGHVVEFSADQYGSRFIQQKLETATIEEKHMVYQEIMPQALALMTDVFGNYVIQKFFEHGFPSQRRELANKLFSHVLTLSLQMYGCRVHLNGRRARGPNPLATTTTTRGRRDTEAQATVLSRIREEREEAEMAASAGSNSKEEVKMKKKEGLGWIEWMRGWLYLAYEMLFQRITASHLQNPMPLPPINDLTCIVTGSTSGIGREIARQLAESGAHVVMAVRNTKAANELIQKWQNEWSGMGLPLNIEVMELDLLSLDSVVRFAEAWNARLGPLHVLINNAGIFSIGEPQKFSKDGYEEHLQVNHLAPALLSVLLLPSLIRGSPSRIVNLNSVMHYVGFVDTEDMNVVSRKRKYTSLVGYSSSKLAQIMFSSVLHKRLPAESGISVVCVSPGIVQTNVARDLPRIVQAAYHLVPYFMFSAQEGSRSALFAATDPQVPEYCELLKTDDFPVCAFISQDCRPTNPSEESHNVDTCHEVWEKTFEMIGLPSDAVERLIEGEEVACRYGAHGE